MATPRVSLIRKTTEQSPRVNCTRGTLQVVAVGLLRRPCHFQHFVTGDAQRPDRYRAVPFAFHVCGAIPTQRASACGAKRHSAVLCTAVTYFLTADAAPLLWINSIGDLGVRYFCNRGCKRDWDGCLHGIVSANDAVIRSCTPVIESGRASRHDLAEAFFNRGFSYLFGKRDYDRAISDYNETIRLGGAIEKFNQRGDAYFHKGDYDRAIAATAKRSAAWRMPN